MAHGSSPHFSSHMLPGVARSDPVTGESISGTRGDGVPSPLGIQFPLPAPTKQTGLLEPDDISQNLFHILFKPFPRLLLLSQESPWGSLVLTWPLPQTSNRTQAT